MRGALALLQRPLLEAFHKRIWNDKPEPPVDIHHPDKQVTTESRQPSGCCVKLAFLCFPSLLLQRTCRRLLAVYDLPSWGRCELALSLLSEHSATYSLEDVVQAVKESHDREFIKRVLAKECPICLSVFPHSKVGRPQMFLPSTGTYVTSLPLSFSDAVADIVPVFSVL